jgi:hypothetical protein
MECSKCGGKVDRISENNYFCRQCGARQETPVADKPKGLLYLLFALNYLNMVVLIAGAIFFFFFFNFYYFTIIMPFFMAVILLWVNEGLKKFDPSMRKYSIIAHFLFIYISIGFVAYAIFVSPYLLAMAILHYYVLYMHKPTVELFRQNS